MIQHFYAVAVELPNGSLLSFSTMGQTNHIVLVPLHSLVTPPASLHILLLPPPPPPVCRQHCHHLSCQTQTKQGSGPSVSGIGSREDGGSLR